MARQSYTGLYWPGAGEYGVITIGLRISDASISTSMKITLDLGKSRVMVDLYLSSTNW
jgi:hypothetical protein